MGTRTITLTDEVYDRLMAAKRDDEEFTDTVARLLDREESDWRCGFGRYSGEDSETFERIVAASHGNEIDERR